MNITADIRAEQFLARILGMKDQMHANVLRAVTRLSIELQGKVKEEKLTGQVLHVRTGTLRRSINRVVNDDPSGATAVVGTNVKYAHVHEFGFHGPVNVRSHTRTLKNGVVQNVRQYVRQMNMPERSFLRSSLSEMAAKIKQDIKQAAVGSIKQ